MYHTNDNGHLGLQGYKLVNKTFGFIKFKWNIIIYFNHSYLWLGYAFCHQDGFEKVNTLFILKLIFKSMLLLRKTAGN